MRKFPYSVSIDYLCPKIEIEFAFYQLGKYAKKRLSVNLQDYCHSWSTLIV